MDSLKTIRKAVMGEVGAKPFPERSNDMTNIRVYMLWLLVSNEVKDKNKIAAAQIGFKMIKEGYCIDEIASRFEMSEFTKKPFVKTKHIKYTGVERTIF